MNKNFPCILPTIMDDYERTKIHYHSIFELLPVDQIIFIGPAALEENIKKDINCGFSEFETYGCWIAMNHTSDYAAGIIKNNYKIMEIPVVKFCD